MSRHVLKYILVSRHVESSDSFSDDGEIYNDRNFNPPQNGSEIRSTKKPLDVSFKTPHSAAA